MTLPKYLDTARTVVQNAARACHFQIFDRKLQKSFAYESNVHSILKFKCRDLRRQNGRPRGEGAPIESDLKVVNSESSIVNRVGAQDFFARKS